MPQNLTFSCGAGGEWYACNRTSNFVGCCSVNPCDSTCPTHALHPITFDPVLHGLFPDFSCPSASNAYSCTRSTTFFGCCKSNPCYNISCPIGDLVPPSLGTDYMRGVFGDPSVNFVGAAPLTTSPPRRAFGPVVPASPVLYLAKIGYRGGVKSMGISIAIFVTICVSVGLWLCVRRFKRLPKRQIGNDEREYLPAMTEESTNDDTPPCRHVTASHCTVQDIRRLGTKTLAMLLATTLIIVAFCILLAFLWFADSRSTVWHQIMVNGWATRSVALSALILRTAVDLQAATATAILASIFMESTRGLRLFQLASLSPMRTGTTSPWTLAKSLFDHIPNWGTQISWDNHIHILCVCLLITTSALQFSSTILLSDLKTGPLIGHVTTSETRTSISYAGEMEKIPRDSAWTTNPPQFPIFGEYAEPQTQAEDGVASTGVLLRALLPFNAAEERQRLAYYQGNAMILDATVSCQAPVLKEFSTTARTSLNRQLVGVVTPSKEIDLLSNITATPFDCAVAWESQISLCQIGLPVGSFTGSLASHFTDSQTYGTAFLVINAAAITSSEWLQVTTQGDGVVDKTTARLSMSLCFAPWDAAILKVSFSGQANRTEPVLQYWKGFETTDVLNYLVPGSNLSTRPVMSMKKPQSLLGDRPPPQRRPLVQSDMSSSSAAVRGTNLPLNGNWTAFTGGIPLITILANFKTVPSQVISADPALAAIFTDAIERYSVAWALSSLITVLSTTNYYGQQAAFDRLDDVEYSSFQDVLYPRDRIGFIVVLWALVAHCTVVGVLVVLFISNTQHTLLGNAWPAFAQLSESAEVRKHLVDVSTMMDSEFYKRLQDTQETELRIRVVGRGAEAEVVLVQ